MAVRGVDLGSVGGVKALQPLLASPRKTIVLSFLVAGGAPMRALDNKQSMSRSCQVILSTAVGFAASERFNLRPRFDVLRARPPGVSKYLLR